MNLLASTETVLLAGINAVVTVVTVAAGVVMAYFALKEKMIEFQKKSEAKLDIVVKDVHKIELATNSMKDALVLATEKEALARGGKEERDRADAAIVVEVPKASESLTTKIDDQAHILEGQGQIQKKSVELLSKIEESTASVDEKTPPLKVK